MAEPTSTAAGGISLAALSVALLGPLAGPYALIVFAALAGALWPLSSAEPMTRKVGAWLLLRCTLTSVALTGALSGIVQAQWGVQALDAFAPVSFLIGALGNGWRPVFESVGKALGEAFGRLLGSKP